MGHSGKARQPASGKTWVGTQQTRGWFVVTFVLGAVMIVAGVAIIVNGPHTAPKPMPEWQAWLSGLVLIILGLALPLLVLVFSKVTVRIDGDAFRWALGPAGRHFRRIEWGDVEAVDTVELRGIHDYWGYGYRWAPGKGTAVVLRSGPAIRVTRSDGKKFTVTVDDAQLGAEAAQAYVRHHQR